MLSRVALLVVAAAAQADAAERICAVMIQDHGGNSLAFSSLNKRLVAIIQAAGYEAMSVQFRPAADVDHDARTGGCKYILYTDVAEIRHAGGPQMTDAMRAAGSAVAGNGKSKGRDIWEADVEFRLFSIDEVPPLLAKSVTGRNGKSSTKASAEAEPAASRSVSPQRPEPDMLTQTTPIDQDGRMKKHKSVAVAAALEREVKVVRERLKRTAAASD
jgi:hypothetical protein